MNLFTLKIIGLIFMVIDHTGMLLFPEQTVLRLLGRIAFPIFGFTVANAFVHTGNRRLYLGRLAVLALVCQLPLWLFRDGETLNIFFTLALGFLVIWAYDALNSRFPGSLWPWLAGAALVVLGEVLNHAGLDLQYAGYGLALIWAYYLCYRRKAATAAAQVLLTLAYLVLRFQVYDITSLRPLFSLLALIPILSYNQRPGPSWKYFFYLFYPLHLLALEALRLLLTAGKI